MSRGCIYSYFSQDKTYSEEIKQYLNRMQKKKNHRRTVHQDLLKTDRAAKPWHRMFLNCQLMGFGGCAREGTSVLFLVLFL